MSLKPLQKDAELNPDAPQESLLRKLSDGPDPPRPVQTARTSTKRFERPNYLHIIAHAVWCCVAYPIIYAGTVAVKDTSLFRARAIVGLWCTGVGVVIGWSLVAFATTYAEAATWATAIHLGHGDNGTGIKLKELAHRAQKPESALSGVRLLWTRFSNRGTDRRARRAVDSRPWSFFIMFYVILILAAAGLPFILGRVVNISTRTEHQFETYTEATIWGDLSKSDIARAFTLTETTSDYYVRSWTLAALTDRSSLSTAARLKYNGDNVYFAELIQSQLKSDGKGPGTFIQNGTVSDTDESSTPSIGGFSEGSLLKIPRWGLRMHCEKLPEPEKYIVPRLNATWSHVIITKAFLGKLFSSFSLPLPDEVENYRVNLYPNDTLPSGVSKEEVGYIASFLNDGMAHSFDSFPYTASKLGNGWFEIETVLVRLDERFVDNASFPVWEVDELSHRIGHDAVVCVEVCEPWIVQVYNSSLGVPTTMAIVGKSASTDFETDHGNRGPHLDSYTRALNYSGKGPAYDLGKMRVLARMRGDNNALQYMPSITTVSFTGSLRWGGYTELSPRFYANVRGKVGASYALPLLSGTGPIVVRAYKDVVLASASFNQRILGGVLGIALLLGVFAGFFVPALPFNIPRRGFGLFSWVAVLHGQELGGEFLQDNVDRHMDLKELEKTLGEKRVRFIIQ